MQLWLYKNNDWKFMFLSEETQPDYQPIDIRKKEKLCPRIDHQPLGADSYSKDSINLFKVQVFREGKKNQTKSSS